GGAGRRAGRLHLGGGYRMHEIGVQARERDCIPGQAEPGRDALVGHVEDPRMTADHQAADGRSEIVGERGAPVLVVHHLQLGPATRRTRSRSPTPSAWWSQATTSWSAKAATRSRPRAPPAPVISTLTGWRLRDRLAGERRPGGTGRSGSPAGHERRRRGPYWM